MTQGRHADEERSAAEVRNYMPGTPRFSSEPGRIERFLGTLFRRRGGVRPARDE